MKRWLVVLAVSLGLLAPAAAFWQSRDSNYNVAISAAATYQGPGDIVGGAKAWSGLRAYSSADRGNPLINACNIADSTCSDLSSDATTGKLTTASVGGLACEYTISSGTYVTATGAVSLVIASSPGLASSNIFGITNLTGTGTFQSLNGIFTATTGTTGTTVNYTAATGLGTVTITGGSISICSIKTFYDRSAALYCGGSACNVTQATIASRGFYFPSCINSLPCMQSNSAAGYVSASFTTGTITGSTTSVVANRNFSTVGAVMMVIGSAGVSTQLSFRGSLANAVQMFNGISGIFASNITDANFHAFQAVFNGSSSNLFCTGGAGSSCSVGGTNNSLSPGTGYPSGTANSFVGINTNLSGAFGNFQFAEGGLWETTIFSGTQQANMGTNQYNFWGPF